VQPAPGVPTPGTVTPVTPETPAMYPGAAPDVHPSTPGLFPGTAPDVHPSTPGLFPGTPPSGTPEAPAPPPSGEPYALKIRKVEAGGLATGGGDLSGDRVITVTEASQPEAEAGAAANVAMTPRRTMQLLAAWWATITNSKANSDRTITAAGLATGGGDLTANRTITVTAASQGQAEEGSAGNVVMTPLRTAQYVAAWWAGLTTAVKTTGNQVISGLKTFATSPRSTGAADADTSLMTRLQVDRRSLPFLRPTDAWQLRPPRCEYFLGGDTTSGSIGDWGWGCSSPPSYGLGEVAMPPGRATLLTTEAIAGSEVHLSKDFSGSTTERYSAISFFIECGVPIYDLCSVIESEVWVGYGLDPMNTNNGRILVGWKKSFSPNFLIWMKSDTNGDLAVYLDTGVPVPTGQTYVPATFVITIVGDLLSYSIYGQQRTRVIIAGVQTNETAVTFVDDYFGGVHAIYGSTLNAIVKTEVNKAKRLNVFAVEWRHAGFQIGSRAVG
jgi:hypothetical protein